jgi:threonine-phosphate decarboxylase
VEIMKKQNPPAGRGGTEQKGQGPGAGGQGTACDHGGNIYKAARELGVPESRIIDFSASINPLGISESVKAVITGNLNGLVHYPDPDADAFRRTVSRLHGIDPGTVLPGNGSTELIYLLPRALKPESVLIPSPTFSEHERACRVADALIIKHYELKKDNFQVNADTFIKAMQGCDMAFLCNPNNPTGQTLHKKDVLTIADAARKIQCVLIVDEAFIDFAPEDSVIEHVKDYPNVIVLRSLTKFYALTGLRTGYGVLPKGLLEKIKKCKEPWTVNNLAQAAAVAALGDKEYRIKTREIMAKEKEYFEKVFQERDVIFFPSSVNFYLLKIGRARDIALKLRRKGILVRNCSNFRGLDESYVRIAVRTRSQNELLIKELTSL